MPTLLERLKGTENDPENESVIPDKIPDEWLDESGQAPVQDPVPGTSKTPRPKLRQAGTSGNVTPALRKRISAELEAYIEFAAIPIVLRDEVCGGVLHEQARPIADAITAILSRYPDLAHKFLQTGVLGDWLKLGVALQPVLKTMWDHHVKAKPEQEESADDQPVYPAWRPGQ
jgi:hypothetical protein